MDTMGDRLKAARSAAKLTQQAVADHFGIARPNISQWESNTTRPEMDKLPALASMYGVTVEWLLDGTGPEPKAGRKLALVKSFDPDGASPEDEAEAPLTERVPLLGYVRAGAAAYYYATASNPLDWVAPIEDGNKDTVAVEIQGESLGSFFDHWLVYYDDARMGVTPDLIGKLCVVGLPDDRVVVKKIKRRRDGLYDLISNHGLEDITGVDVLWAAKVKHMAPR